MSLFTLERTWRRPGVITHLPFAVLVLLLSGCAASRVTVDRVILASEAATVPSDCEQVARKLVDRQVRVQLHDGSQWRAVGLHAVADSARWIDPRTMQTQTVPLEALHTVTRTDRLAGARGGAVVGAVFGGIVAGIGGLALSRSLPFGSSTTSEVVTGTLLSAGIGVGFGAGIGAVGGAVGRGTRVYVFDCGSDEQ